MMELVIRELHILNYHLMNLSCLAKERCIPVTDVLKLLDSLTQICGHTTRGKGKYVTKSLPADLT